MRRELERRRWYGMIQRCENPKHVSYPNYGAKGVGVDPVWRASYDTFLRDVGRAPSPAHTLDRIDSAKGYVPGNVRWATHKEQQRNRTNNTRVIWGGRTITQIELAEMCGLAKSTVATRMRSGWTVEEIVARAASPLSERTHCPHGHPYSGDNLILREHGHRVCRACKKAVAARCSAALRAKRALASKDGTTP